MIRDGSLPSLLGRYVYADIFNVFGGELRTVQLFAGGSSGDAGLGVTATSVASFGEDACAHIYVASLEGAVYRLDPAGVAPICSPQGAPAGIAPVPLVQPQTVAPTGRRAAALRKCKKKRGIKRKRCRRRAKRLPI